MLTTIPTNGETWIICGGRDFADGAMFDGAMSDILGRYASPKRIIHGAQTGADTMAGDLAKRLAIDVEPCPAEWKKYGRAAGPIRNREMLKFKPHKVIAFPGGDGTANMVRQARKAGVDVIEVKKGGE